MQVKVQPSAALTSRGHGPAAGVGPAKEDGKGAMMPIRVVARVVARVVTAALAAVAALVVVTVSPQRAHAADAADGLYVKHSLLRLTTAAHGGGATLNFSLFRRGGEEGASDGVLTFDLEDLRGVATVSSTSPNCRAKDTTLTCAVKPPVEGHGQGNATQWTAMLRLRTEAGVKPGTRAVIAYSAEGAGLTLPRTEATLTVVPTPEWRVTAPPLEGTVKPGDTVTVPFTLLVGDETDGEAVVVSFNGSPGLALRDRHSNCWYDTSGTEDGDAYCLFERGIEPGRAHTLDRPLRLKLTDDALNEQIEIRAEPMSGDDYARRQLFNPRRGDGRALGLVETDLPADADSARPSSVVSVMADSSTDDAVTLEESTFTGAVGDTVLLRPGFKAHGPGRRRTPQDKGNSALVEYVLPRGTSVAHKRDLEGCRTLERGRRFTCPLVVDLELRLDEPLADARGTVSLVAGPRDDGLVYDRNRANNSVAFTVTAAGAGGTSARAITGVVLLCTATGLLGGAVLTLVRRRGRRRPVALVLVGALVCGTAGGGAFAGVWPEDRSVPQGFPAARYRLDAGRNILDTGRIFEPVRPDEVPAIAIPRDPANERDMTEVSAYYSSRSAGGSPQHWSAFDGAYGRIRDTDRARKRMLEAAAETDGVEVVEPAEDLSQKDGEGRALTVRCQGVTFKGRRLSMCAWADGNTRGLVTTLSGSFGVGAAAMRNEIRAPLPSDRAPHDQPR